MSTTRARGFSLIELLIGLLVSSIILIAVGAVFVAVGNRFQAEGAIMESVESGRAAITYIERTTRQAGYGIDPKAVFDLGTVGLPGTTKDNFAGTGFTTDDLAFRYRDPVFVRRGKLQTGSLTLTAAFGVALRVNQPIIIGCAGAISYYVGRLQTAVAATATTVTLLDYGAPFSTTPPFCAATTGAAYVMLLNEVRLRIIPLGGRPYLVAFHNFEAIAGNSDFDPIAADVEDFQVAYVLNRPKASSTCCAATVAIDASTNSNWILGDIGTADLLPVIAATRPDYEMAYDDAARFTADPTNVRALRVSLVLRSQRKLPIAATGFPQLVVENHDPGASLTTTGDGFYRTVISTTVRTGNLLSRSFFVPPVSTLAGDGLNISGG